MFEPLKIYYLLSLIIILKLMDFQSLFNLLFSFYILSGGVAELEYAVDLKSTVRKELRVQVPSPLPFFNTLV